MGAHEIPIDGLSTEQGKYLISPATSSIFDGGQALVRIHIFLGTYNMTLTNRVTILIISELPLSCRSQKKNELRFILIGGFTLHMDMLALMVTITKIECTHPRKKNRKIHYLHVQPLISEDLFI